MPFRKKLVIFLSIYFLVLISLIIVNYFANNSREKIYFEDQKQKLIFSSKTSIEQTNEFLENITFDYTYWDDMQNFNFLPDSVWADENLNSMIDAYGVDYVWVYNLSGEKQYSTYNIDYPELENPIDRNKLYTVFDTIENSSKRFASYNLKNDTCFLIIFAATVHSTKDIDRLEKPTGFLFIANVIDNEYLEKLSIITDCETSLLSDTNINFLDENNTILFSNNELKDLDENFIASINFKRNDNLISVNRRYNNVSMIVFLIIILILMISILLFSNLSFSAPLNNIIKSLNTNDPEYILPLSKKQKNEFGQISNLILLFFKQKQNLETEIEERKSIEEQLKESIEELNMKNEEIHAQSEVLSYANKNLEKLSVVASKTNNSVIISNNLLEIEYVNEGFLKLYELTQNDWEKMQFKRIDLLSQYSDFLKIIEICRETQKSEIYVSDYRTIRNNSKWIQTNITPTFDQFGNPEFFIFIEVDITFFKEAEEKIAKQNKNITSSIIYASRIQNALFPPIHILKRNFSESFVFYQPKEVISGDFFWINTKNNLTYFTVADCTGHGVPGAFMSILSISILNDIVNTIDRELSAARIVGMLREKIITVLHQDELGSENKDGLDISLCVIDRQKQKIQFAGAHNPLYVIKDELTVIEADKIPVSISNRLKDFTNHILDFCEDNVYYMFSDGFSDQFGHLSKRKYYVAKFKHFLISIHKEKLSKQEQLIKDEFNNWKGNLLQVDDVLVVGFKI